MKTIRTLALLFTGLSVTLSSQAASVLPGDITSNVSPTFTTVDTLLTINGYSDSASTVPANMTSSGPGTWFGVAGGDALNGTETMTLQLAPGVGLTGFGDIWTRAVISIAGFNADPGLSVGANPGVLGSSYSSGTLVLDLNWNGGGARDFTLANPAASSGQLLTLSLDSGTAPQWAITRFDYAVVPEPSIAALLLLGGGLVWARARGSRR